MFVYTKSFEGVTAYSTARKLIESIEVGTIFIGDDEIDMANKTEKDVKRLIKVLNSKWYLTVFYNDFDSDTLQKCLVK